MQKCFPMGLPIIVVLFLLCATVSSQSVFALDPGTITTVNLTNTAKQMCRSEDYPNDMCLESITTCRNRILQLLTLTAYYYNFATQVTNGDIILTGPQYTIAQVIWQDFMKHKKYPHHRMPNGDLAFEFFQEEYDNLTSAQEDACEVKRAKCIGDACPDKTMFKPSEKAMSPVNKMRSILSALKPSKSVSPITKFNNHIELIQDRVTSILGYLRIAYIKMGDAAVEFECPESDDASYFLRGDVTGDCRISSADALFLADYLGRGKGSLNCLDAADTNDDGRIDFEDVDTILKFIFQEQGPLKIHPPQWGPDLSADQLQCAN